MFKNILVAMDNSPMGEQVFNEALGLAEARGSRLLLLHVLSSEDAGSPQLPVMLMPEYYPGLSDQTLSLYEEQFRAYEKQGLARLQSQCEVAKERGVETEFTQITGSAGRTICRIAKEWDADLVLVGRRGHSGLSELLIGSISNYVMHHAPCSVLVIHAPAPAQLESSSPSLVQG
ncbi:universal stress protein [Synechococcales cyanobacterium C]|uniref:Universal stress protein n=1 Tax=Petrachloros mirabilis ULC683 TaxID=2781853 RepID=A0A8K1ZYV3_9CYAN|nr:universal stress protein [Petrachloros mirabilis]NCJ07338.1 universal stress protein [Petrachloros mirabilis ULC683]